MMETWDVAPAKVHRAAQNVAAAEEDHVGGGQLVGDDDGVRIDPRKDGAPAEVANDAVLKVEQVAGPLAQVFAFAGFEHLPVLLDHGVQCVVGVAPLVPNLIDDGIEDGGVAQHEGLRVKDAGAFLAHLFTRHRSDLAQLVLGLLDGPLEPLDLPLDVLIANSVPLDLEISAGVEVGRTDGDAGRNADAAQNLLVTSFPVPERGCFLGRKIVLGHAIVRFCGPLSTVR